MIPAGWKSVTASELASERTGSVDPAKFPDEIFDLYSIPSYDTGEPEVLAGREIGSSKKVVKEGDILISKIVPHIRRVWIVGPNRGRRQIASGEWISFSDEGIYPDYLRYFLLSDGFHTKFMSTITGVGGSLLRARPSEVNKIAIPIPPFATQQHIARVLEQAGQLRKQAQHMERELNRLAQSLFLEMFGDPVKNEKSWPQFALAQLTSKIGSGSTPTGGKEAYKDNGISLVRSMNVHDGEFLYKDLARIDDQQANALSNVVVESQDVLLNITGASVCRCCVVPDDVLPARVNQHVAILRPDNVKLTTAYLQALIVSHSFKTLLLQLAGAAGATREALTKGALEILQIPTPPLDKQIEFGRAMNSISRQIDSAKRKQAQLNSLFDALMQRAFNGELTERKAA